MADDRARMSTRMPQEVYDRLCAELPAFSTDTARFQFLAQFYLDYKDMHCRCMTQAHPPVESHTTRAHPREETTSRSDHQSPSTTDSDTASDATDTDTQEPTDDQSDSAIGGEDEASTGRS